jgi:uncharacterized protein DUF2782
MNLSRSALRFIVAVALAASAAGVGVRAQNPPSVAPLPPPPPPANTPQLEPLPEIPPPPGVGADVELEPQVTITRRQGETVEEARVNGRVIWIKVTPQHGRPYFLIPDGSGSLFIRRDAFDTGFKVPLWLLLEF